MRHREKWDSPVAKQNGTAPWQKNGTAIADQ